MLIRLKMKTFIRKHMLGLIGMVVGAVAGYAYYFFIGCASGTCPITSNPFISVIYGALLGFLLFDIFKPKKKTDEAN